MRPIRKDYIPKYGSELYYALEHLVDKEELGSGDSPYLSRLFYYGMAKRTKLSGVFYRYTPSRRAKECLALLKQKREEQVKTWKEEEFFEFF